MYVTAQRVRSRATGRQGINCFFYRHDDRAYPEIQWNEPVVHMIQTTCPGRLVDDSDREVEPGGNQVVSYLDVAAEDAIRPEGIEAALSQFPRIIQPQTREVVGQSLSFVALDQGAAAQLGIATQAIQSRFPPAVVIDRIAIAFDAVLRPHESGVDFYLQEFEVLKARALSLLRKHQAGD